MDWWEDGRQCLLTKPREAVFINSNLDGLVTCIIKAVAVPHVQWTFGAQTASLGFLMTSGARCHVAYKTAQKAHEEGDLGVNSVNASKLVPPTQTHTRNTPLGLLIQGCMVRQCTKLSICLGAYMASTGHTAILSQPISASPSWTTVTYRRHSRTTLRLGTLHSRWPSQLLAATTPN